MEDLTLSSRRAAQAMAAGLGLAAIVLPALLWFAEILAANLIAHRDFGVHPCWFVQEDHSRGMPELAAGPRDIYVPNPFRQINRRFFGFGLDDANILAPHFAVAARDERGRPALWGWSYGRFDFWPLSANAESRGGLLVDFATAETVRSACPDIAQPVNRREESAMSEGP